MSSEFNPGEFVILGFDGLIPEDNFIAMIEEFPPSGIMFLARNYSSPEQLTRLISKFTNSIGRRVLFAVDQEPGRVQRFKSGFPRSKLPREYLKSEGIGQYINWCRQTASMLSEIGVNLNLAPVIDMIDSSGIMPVLDGRSFGDDIKTVSEFARILIREHKQSDVHTCLKHFPGLGSAKNDPHLKLSLSDLPLEKFEEYHWKPFQAMIESEAEAVMTTHLLAESIDPVNPATYSKVTINCLRDRLNFEGVVISDDMIMKGSGDKGNIAENVTRALESGHNLVIISENIEAQRSALETIREKYFTDNAFADILDKHEKVIQRFKVKFQDDDQIASN